MKVLMTHHYFPPDFAGGGEYVALETARGLMERGIDVQILTTGDPRISQYEGIPTTRIPIHRYGFNLAYRKILTMARDVDLIQTYNYHACLPSLAVGKHLKKPVVCYILGLVREAWGQLRPHLAAKLWSAWERFLLTRDYSKVIVPSEHARNFGLQIGVPPSRLVVNCPGIDIEKYGPANRKEDVVFFTGRLDGRRGVDNVLATARRLPQVRFQIMGWGPEEDRLRRSASANVEFVKFERGEPLRNAFAAARIFFLPTRAESFGIAVVEAMASGCAVISSAELPFEGRRIQPDDPEAMAASVARLWANREETEVMGRRNMELAQQYSWDRFTRITIDTYKQVLKGDRACRP
jgi:glycosyltransferase involved in cell wall biosynthesis